MKLTLNTSDTMTTRQIADLTGKKHCHVLRDFERMCGELEVDQSKFGSGYLDVNGQERKEYALDQDLTMTLITGYNANARLAVMKRWRELEALKPPQSYSEVLFLAAKLQKEKEENGQFTHIGRTLSDDSKTNFYMREWANNIRKALSQHFPEQHLVKLPVEKQLYAYLRDEGYLYIDQGTRQHRPYKQHSGKYFLLVLQNINGANREILKVTSKAVFDLTPGVVKHFLPPSEQEDLEHST